MRRAQASPELDDAFDMPCLNDGPAGRRAVNPALLAEIIAKSHASKAYVEIVGARPGEGAVGAFAFGRSRGVVEGVLAALGVPVVFIAPASWKRAVGLPPGRDGAKDAARSAAIARWPAKAALFARVKDDGRAEAALIAVAGLMREARQ
jgi:crossover junction endodeoxyribonuclease RuvC